MNERGYGQIVVAQMKKQVLDDDPVQQRCKLVSFTSTFNGVGRPKRKPRQVELLVTDRNKAYQVISGEIRSRDKRDLIGPDRLAEEVLTDTPSDERTPSELLRRAVNNAFIELELRDVARRYSLNKNLKPINNEN